MHDTLGALGVDPNFRTASGYTALHAAASKNHLDAIHALVHIRKCTPHLKLHPKPKTAFIPET